MTLKKKMLFHKELKSDSLTAGRGVISLADYLALWKNKIMNEKTMNTC